MTTVGLDDAVEEVRAGPGGSTVGAFFDFDGTLIAGFSALHLSRERVRSRDVSVTEVARTLALGVQAGLGRAGFEDLLGIGAAAWKGRDDADLRTMGERVFERRITDIVYPEARELVLAHRDRGHTLVLSSSATEYQVDPMARYLGIDHVVCNRYTKEDGRLTGSLEQPVIWGPTKASGVEAFALDHGIDLAKSWFYADGDEDVALIRVVGHPRPTNPSKGLAGVAADEGWPTLRFTSRAPRSTGSRAKQGASAVALMAATAGGGVVAAARRDRGAGANFVTRQWLSAVFAINGVQVKAQGEEHLEAPRPAVFVYNHRNNIDGFIAASLVGRDFVAVGDHEVADNRMVALLSQISGITFLPGDDAARRDAITRLVATATAGRSILIAPEGVRTDTTTVGPFEDDAFLVAIEAGLPIVPIVIHNADRIAGRSASVMVGGVVDVTVLPPIESGRGAVETVGELTTEVRRCFVESLQA